MTASHRTCPVCTLALAAHLHEGVELDLCPAGHGVWLDKGELHQVVNSEAAARTVDEGRAAVAAALADAGTSVVIDASQRAARACPVCTAPMAVREYPGSGVSIDTCQQHGDWLDAGELERIEAYGEAMRRRVAEGAAGDAEAWRPTVRGLAVPPEVLATLRSAVHQA